MRAIFFTEGNAGSLNMRLALLCSLALAMTQPGSAEGADFPYEAFIATDQTEVVAGPGHRYYATDRLARGTKIEIYREEASGWLAIRPPEGSFSWIPAEFVERVEDNLGRVAEPTGAWVGTAVEHVSEHQQQVTLKAGELVEIIGEKAATAKSGKQQTWLKIAPPAGEYRWVYMRDVSRHQPQEPGADILRDGQSQNPGEDETTSNSLPPDKTREPRRLEKAGNAIALSDIEVRPARIDRGIRLAQFQSAAPGKKVAAPISPDGFVPRKRPSEDGTALANGAASRPAAAPMASRPRLDSNERIAEATPPRRASTINVTGAAGTPAISGDEVARKLDQLELELSLMVAQDRSQWNLAALQRRAETLVEEGADPASRGRARLVLDKIQQFENAFDRSPRTLTPSGGSGTKTSSAAESGNRTLADPRYDAEGWLKPVVSRKSGKPIAPYAVVDADGQPICFVSPAPGLNLHRYENKQVGLYGRRGFLEELKKPHLVAERVIEMDVRLR